MLPEKQRWICVTNLESHLNFYAPNGLYLCLFMYVFQLLHLISLRLLTSYYTLL